MSCVRSSAASPTSREAEAETEEAVVVARQQRGECHAITAAGGQG